MQFLMDWLELLESGIYAVMHPREPREKTRKKNGIERKKYKNTLPDKNVWLLLFSVSNIVRHGLWYSGDLMRRKE